MSKGKSINDYNDSELLELFMTCPIDYCILENMEDLREEVEGIYKKHLDALQDFCRWHKFDTWNNQLKDKPHQLTSLFSDVLSAEGEIPPDHILLTLIRVNSCLY